MPKLATVLRHSCQYLLFVAPVHVVVPGWLGGGECAGFNWSLESDWKCRCCSQKKWNLIDWSIFKGGNVRKSSKHIKRGNKWFTADQTTLPLSILEPTFNCPTVNWVTCLGIVNTGNAPAASPNDVPPATDPSQQHESHLIFLFSITSFHRSECS